MVKSLECFDSVIARANELCDLRASGPKIKEQDDLVRSAIVLAVAGFDAYFTDKFCDILVPFLKLHKPGASLVKVLHDAGLDTVAALEMLSMQRPYRRIRTLVQAHLSAKTTQRFAAIDELFISIGLKDLCKNAEKKTGYKSLNTRIEALVLKRHEIAHEADINSHGRIRAIDLAKIKRRIADLSKFVHACDDIINSRTAKPKKVAVAKRKTV
jgi:RiboL-PSP-HEPN